jgi:hypothetical protein
MFRIAFILLSCSFVFSPATSFARVSKSHHLHATDPSYSFALAAANRFLHAWQTQDHETGIMMLSDEARQRISPEQLQEFFSPGPAAAFEIQHGKRINGGEYAFPVTLFGVSGQSLRAHVSSIVITRAGKEDWEVQKLP